MKKRRAQELTQLNRDVRLQRAEQLLKLYPTQATPAFIPPDQWPPNSPDLNPMDYKIWSIVQQRVYQSRVHNVSEVKQRLMDVWHGMEQSVIDSAIDEWRLRLQACVRAKGGHFEQKM